MVDVEMLEKVMEDADITNIEMAEACKIDESTWYRKKAQPENFTIGNIEAMKKKLKLSNEKAVLIFLN